MRSAGKFKDAPEILVLQNFGCVPEFPRRPQFSQLLPIDNPQVELLFFHPVKRMNTPAVVVQLNILSDAIRVRMLAVLEGRELTVSELCDVVQLPQSTVSRH